MQTIPLENRESIKRLKRTVREHWPGPWEAAVRFAWEIRTRVRLLEPLLFTQLRMISGTRAKPQAASGKRILFFQTRSNPPHLSWAGTMALALEARGNKSVFVGCSRELSDSCNNANYPDGLSPHRCRGCFIYTRRFLQLSGIDTSWLGRYIDVEDRRRAEALLARVPPGSYESFSYKDLPLGKIVRHSVAHYLRTGGIAGDPTSRDVYRKFLVNGILMVDASAKILDEHDPDIVLMLCGLFMPEHVMMGIARARGKRVVVYEIGMLAQDALMLQHDRPIDYDDRDGWERYKSIPLTNEENKRLDEYLFERSEGRMSVINYWPEKEDDERKICAELDIDRSKPIVTLFPNITWDSALFEKDIGFAGMFDWLDRSIAFFIAHPEYQLIVRAHPAEMILPGSLRESVISYITGKYGTLPKNIILIPPQSKISSYALMNMSQCGLSYASTTAIELGVRGIPVLVAGEVHFRRKGFTIDIDEAATYHEVLLAVLRGECALHRPTIAETARKYAYFTFFRASIPFSKIHCGASDQPIFTYTTIDEVLPGKDRALDIICEGIVSGKPFLYEESRLHAEELKQPSQCAE